jgi:hypothetical protein
MNSAAPMIIGNNGPARPDEPSWPAIGASVASAIASPEVGTMCGWGSGFSVFSIDRSCPGWRLTRLLALSPLYDRQLMNLPAPAIAPSLTRRRGANQDDRKDARLAASVFPGMQRPALDEGVAGLE